MVAHLLVREPRPVDLYEQVKAELIARFGESHEARLRHLIQGEVSTDGRPLFIIGKFRAVQTPLKA